MSVTMTPAQMRCFDELLCIGGSRPVTPPQLAIQLRGIIEAGTSRALEMWTERSLWFGKSQMGGVLRCEGNVVANRLEPSGHSVTAAIAVGQITHRAIQLSHTHRGRSVDEYVRLAVAGCMVEASFAEYWNNAGEQAQSDALMQAASRTCSFLDTFPPLESSWTPRFEESIQVKCGRLTLAARPDLVLGRPRGDGKQTMFLCDFKSGELRDEHLLEAQYYALVSTLRNGCAPYRSTVLSLSSGEWTDPDITAEDLIALAHVIVRTVTQYVEVLVETREPVLQAGMHCSWCPAKPNCEAHMLWKEAGMPSSGVTLSKAALLPTSVPVSVPLGRSTLEVVSVGASSDADHDPFAL